MGDLHSMSYTPQCESFSLTYIKQLFTCTILCCNLFPSKCSIVTWKSALERGLFYLHGIFNVISPRILHSRLPLPVSLGLTPLATVICCSPGIRGLRWPQMVSLEAWGLGTGCSRVFLRPASLMAQALLLGEGGVLTGADKISRPSSRIHTVLLLPHSVGLNKSQDLPGSIYLW